MKFTKKVFIAALTLVFATAGLFPIGASAQEEIKPAFKKRANHRFEKQAEKLGLSDEQKTTFLEIHKKYRAQAKAFKAKTQSREELRELIHTNQKAKTAEIKNLLTPEQYAIFDKVDENRKGKGKKGKKGKRGDREKKERKM